MNPDNAATNLDKAEARRLLNLLETFMRLLGISRREAERRLGIKHSAVTRLFKGYIEPKLELILGVVRVIGLEPGEFFALAYPSWRNAEPKSESARYLLSMLQELYPGGIHTVPPPPPPPPEPTAVPMEPEEVMRQLRELMRETINKLQDREKELERVAQTHGLAVEDESASLPVRAERAEESEAPDASPSLPEPHTLRRSSSA